MAGVSSDLHGGEEQITLEQEITTLQVFKLMAGPDKEAVLEIIRKHEDKIRDVISTVYMTQEETKRKEMVVPQIILDDLTTLKAKLKALVD